MRDARTFLTPEEKKLVDEAIASAEARTSGEIVPVIATRSREHSRGLYHAAIATVFVVTAGVFALQCLPFGPLEWHPADIPFKILVPLQFVALLGGFHAARRFPRFHRAFIARAEMDIAVDRAAKHAFRDFKLEDTAGRTGIMLYVSLFEHVAVVLADKSIASRLEHKSWDGVRDLLIRGLASDQAARGFVDAIEACGRVLEKEFPRQPDDVNELPDHLRIIA